MDMSTFCSQKNTPAHCFLEVATTSIGSKLYFRHALLCYFVLATSPWTTAGREREKERRRRRRRRRGLHRSEHMTNGKWHRRSNSNNGGGVVEQLGEIHPCIRRLDAPPDLQLRSRRRRSLACIGFEALFGSSRPGRDLDSIPVGQPGSAWRGINPGPS
jgi:hypothetical protein